MGVTWGEPELFEIRDLYSGKTHSFDLGSPPLRTTAFADQLTATLADGTDLALAFAPDGSLLVEVHAAAEPTPRTDLPWQIHHHGDGQWWIQVAATDSSQPPADLFERNRERWNWRFKTAASHLAQADDAGHQLLLARAVTTLLWNHRRPTAELRHHGVIPSPFAYCGYWAWDSWKHAHALATFAPELAAEQLRVQFSRQNDSGMVPDTVMPHAADDNWLNTKPPLAAWALLKVWHHTHDTGLVEELWPKCVAQIKWWHKNRRAPGEALFRAGGVDYETATWDTGWDLCRRFDDVELQSYGDWKLFDLWQPDINAYLLNEYRALAELAAVIEEPVQNWRLRAAGLEQQMREQLWCEDLSCFCDVRPSTGAPTGVRSAAAWLPLWAGIDDGHIHALSIEVLTDPDHFDTPMPFPTLAASAKGFDPNDYWSGGVWVDHAAWAFQVLERHRPEVGLEQRRRLLKHLLALPSLYECYSPLTGQPVQGNRPAVAQFSWTAAACIEMLSAALNYRP